MEIKVNINTKIDYLVEKEILEDLADLPNGYTEAQKDELVKCFIENIEKQVTLIESKDLESDVNFSKFYRGLLSNVDNKRTRKIFEIITGKQLGKTIKQAEAVFVDYFGNFLSLNDERENEVKAQMEIDKQNAILSAEKESFSSPLWDYDKILKMSPMQKGTFKKALEKLWRFNGVVRSMKEQLLYDFENSNIDGKKITNHMWKWSRSKYNNMDGREQREYEAKLLKGRSYHASLKDGFLREIPKVIYDVLNLSDTTNHEALKGDAA